LSTPAWAGKFGEGTDLNKMLDTLPNSGNGVVDKVSILALGLLWCDGGLKDKCDVLMGIINPPGQADEKIANNDKEMIALLDTIFLIASWWTEETAAWLNPGNSMKRFFADEEKTKRVVNAFVNIDDDGEKQGFIDTMFGCESTVKRHEFIMTMNGKMKWFFKSKEIRDRMKPFTNELWLNDWEKNQ